MNKLLLTTDEFVGTRKLRANMTSILKDIKENDRAIVVTTSGTPVSVMVSIEGYVSLMKAGEDLRRKEFIEAASGNSRQFKPRKTPAGNTSKSNRQTRESKTTRRNKGSAKTQ